MSSNMESVTDAKIINLHSGKFSFTHIKSYSKYTKSTAATWILPDSFV